MSHLKAVLALACAVLLLAGCAVMTRLAYSNMALAYENLPAMASWWVDDYVEVHGSQKDWVRERIERAFAWHRSQELPEYRRFLEHVLAESAEPFTVAEIADAYQQMRKRYHRAVEHLLPDIADFFLQLTPEQVQQLEKKFGNDNRKFVRDSGRGSDEERRRKRMKRFIEHMENWLGTVTGAQRELIEQHYRGLPDYVEERLEDRRLRHAMTLKLIRSKPSREETIAGLRRLLIDTEGWRRKDFTQKMLARDQRMFEMFAALSATLSPEQRAHLQKRIRGFIRDIDTLTAAR